MTQERLRYVTVRSNRDGTKRYYWQRRGHKLVALPDDPVRRFAMASRLNAAADQAGGRDEPPERSLGWVIDRYKGGLVVVQDLTPYTKLKRGTLKYYDRFLRDIADLGPNIFFEDLTAEDVGEFILAYAAVADRRKAKAVFGAIYSTAMVLGCATAHHARNVKVERTQPRTTIWSDDEVGRWLEAAELHRHAGTMKDAFMLLRFTAQRPNDCLLMSLERYVDDYIALTQEKTRKLVHVPVHTELKAHLDASLAARPRQHLVAQQDGRPVPYPSFNRWFVEVRRAAGLPEDLQARDLRRTAMIRMSEAGATPQEVAAVSGHTIDETMAILEVYIPRTAEMARSAIRKWQGRRAKRPPQATEHDFEALLDLLGGDPAKLAQLLELAKVLTAARGTVGPGEDGEET